MADALVKFLKEELKWNPDWVDNLSKDEVEPEVINRVKAEMNEHNYELFRSRYGEDFKREAIEEGKKIGALTYGGTLKNRIAKTLGMTMSRSEVEKMEEEDFLKKVERMMRNQIDEASQITDVKAKQKIEELQERLKNTTNELNSYLSTRDDEIEKINREAQLKIDTYRIEDLKSKMMANMDWAPHADKDAGHLFITKYLEENYQIHPDGSITGKDGTKALRPDGHGFYDNAVDAYKDIFDQRGYGKRSHGGNADRSVNGFVPNNDEKVNHDNARELLERARQKAKQQQELGLKL